MKHIWWLHSCINIYVSIQYKRTIRFIHSFDLLVTDISKDNSNDCLECEWYGQLYCSGDIIIDLYSWKFLKKCADGKMGIYGRYRLWRITELIVTMQKLYLDHGKRCLRIPGLRWVFHYQASLLSLTIFINFLIF